MSKNTSELKHIMEDQLKITKIIWSLSAAVLLLYISSQRVGAQSSVQPVALRTISGDVIINSPAFSDKDLSAAPRNNWLKSGGNLFNQNYSPLSQINRDTVANLKGVWRTHLDGSGAKAKYSGEAQPIVYEGVIYIVTGADDVFGLSVKTGEILWKYEAHLDDGIKTICCGWTSRGVGLGDGRVYVGQLDGKLVALDQKTGNPAWSIQAENSQNGYTITAAPLYYDGLVIVGFAGAERATRGRIKAYDAKNGKLVWTFYTVPAPGEFGHDTWPQNSKAWSRGGATVWQTPAVDPELGLIYFSTGNPGPDFNGHIRPGNNLFATSIVAVDAHTGKYKWHFQQIHHDIWDYDGPNPVILFNVKINGRLRKAAAEASKAGWVYILDRTNGKPLIGIDEKPVAQDLRQATSPTQPIPRGDPFVPQMVDIAPEGYSLVNQGRTFTPFWMEPVVAAPSSKGGANWPPSSYDPDTNYFYVCATDLAGAFRGGEEIEKIPAEGQSYLGGAFGGVPVNASGIFAALDMKTNRLVWQQRWKEPCYSGSITTGGGLVFAGKNDGHLTAMNSATGKRLWDFQTGAGMNAPPSVFEYEGEEYVVAYSAGNVFAGSPRGDSVWLFSLKGTLKESAPATSVIPPATHQ
jgi:alcohol dehydrogenase (cytochrome c)